MNDYFSRPDTSARNSPVGIAMQLLMEKHPQMIYGEARKLAREHPYRGKCASFESLVASRKRFIARFGTMLPHRKRRSSHQRG